MTATGCWQPNKNYLVKKGDSLYTIARQHHITIGQLKSQNSLTSNTLQIGQRLELPGQGTTPVAAKSLEETVPDTTYRIKQSDTLWSPAKRFDVAVTDLLHRNKLEHAAILQPGQEIKLAGSGVGHKTRIKKVNYRVRRGDSLSRIAGKFNLRIKDIIDWNSINLKSYLHLFRGSLNRPSLYRFKYWPNTRAIPAGQTKRT